MLFDFDGLLVDTETAAFEAWRGLFADHGHALAVEDWLPNVGANPEPFDPRERLEALVGSTLAWEELDLRRRADRLSRCRPCPGAREVMAEALALGLRTGLVSNSPREWVDQHLELAGLDATFDTVILRGDGHRPKPAPDMYLAALDDLGVPAGAAIAFEDSPSGVAAARAAGIHCVAVPNEVTALLALEADVTVSSLAHVSLAELRATVPFDAGAEE